MSLREHFSVWAPPSIFLVMSKNFGHFDSLISMIWGHHWIENSRKWGGFWGSQGPAIGSQASFKILSATAGIPHFFSSSAVLLQCRSKFWNLLGNLSQALETPRTPPILFKIMKLCQNLNLLLKRLEIDWNQFFDRFFFESRFYRVFSGATCTKLSDFFSEHFYDKNFKFSREKSGNQGISSETTETRLRAVPIKT